MGVALHGTPPLLTLAGTLAQDLALVAGALLVAAAALKGRVTAAHLGLRPARVGSSAAYVVAGYVGFLVLAAAWTSALGIKDRESVAIDLGTHDSLAALAGAALLVCVVAPVCEELFFRGFLFGALRKRGLLVATLVSGLAFGWRARGVVADRLHRAAGRARDDPVAALRADGLAVPLDRRCTR